MYIDRTSKIVIRQIFWPFRTSVEQSPVSFGTLTNETCADDWHKSSTKSVI